MAKIVGLPKLSPTMEEGTLARWAKKEGDALAIDDLVAEVETDKATMEWRAFDKGVLLKILVPEGTTLKPDQPVAIIGQQGEDIGALVAQVGGAAGSGDAQAKGAEPAKSTAAAKSSAAETPRAKESGAGVDARGSGEERSAEPGGAKRESAEGRAPIATPAHDDAPSDGAAANGHDGRVRASPLVRRLAREHDVDLRSVQGSGPGGRIVKKDLDSALAAPAAPAPAASRGTGGAPAGARVPPVAHKLSQMRKTIARRLTESKQTVPHFYLTIDVDAAPLADARQQINALLERSAPRGSAPEKISVNDLLIKACGVALRRVPAVNASFAGDQILLHQVVDVSVAVAVPDGLMTPVVRDADRKGVTEIAREVRELAGRAREKKLKVEEMTGGTFSISNLGMYGIEDFSAVINPPEGAILAVGALREEPVVAGGVLTIGKRMRMTLSCDHRVIDGATGAEWLAALRAILESPITMVM